jgi:phosphoribosylamine--glycine ligase
MKVLVVDSGGRGHAICWKAAQSDLVDVCYWAPVSSGVGISGKIIPVPVAANDISQLIRFSQDNGVELIIPGPEDPLFLGFADEAQKAGIGIFGPIKEVAILEGSKAYAKEFMKQNNIPTADFEIFDDAQAALKFVTGIKYPVVVKADGPALGKGVIPCENEREASDAITRMMLRKEFGDAGKKIVVEKFLDGEEASYIVLVDSNGNILPLASSQDHKRAGNGDKGPNTGGMGAYSPAPLITWKIEEKILQCIVYPTLRGLKIKGIPYIGPLYFGLMIVDGNPWLLEYNVRLGDPEAQVILPRMRTDLIWTINQALQGNLDVCKIDWDPRICITVVMASKGYPGKYEKGFPIYNIEEAERMGAIVFHAGTAINEQDQLVTNSGRVVDPTHYGSTYLEAQQNVYQAVSKIKCDNLFYRSDIAWRAVEWERRR